MNNALLSQLAYRSGGKYFPASDIRGLADAVQASKGFSPKERILRSDIQLWNLLWLLAMAIAVFAAEWYVRKQSGML